MTVVLERAPIEAPPPPTRARWLWVAVIAFVVSVVGAIAHSPWLALDEVEIVGADRAPVATLVSALGIGEGALMIWINTGAIEQAVLADPWVRDVKVDRVIPDRLVVAVLEHTPAMWVEGMEGWMLVSRDGTVLETAEVASTGLPRAVLAVTSRAPGDVPREPIWRESLALALTLPPDLGAEAVLAWEGAELWLSLPGYRARLGFPNDLGDKARVLSGLLADGVPAGSIIDLVAPTRPAVVPPPSSGDLDDASSPVEPRSEVEDDG